MLDGYPIQTAIQVRWNDMDALGHVNNTVYFSYFEAARVRFYESLDLVPARGGKNMGFNLVATSCNFRREIRYPEDVVIASRIVKIGRSSFHFEHGLLAGEHDTPAADATSVVVWCDFDARKSVELPAGLRAVLGEYTGVTR